LIQDELDDAYLDCRLSRKAILCTESTLEFYKYTVGKFIEWLEISSLNDLKVRRIRAYLASLSERGLKDSSIHGHARAIRTFSKFLYAEGYIEDQIRFKMPAIRNKEKPFLSADEVETIIESCERRRDRAIILFIVDTGIRRSEVCSLSWGDVDLETGVIGLDNGKGRKARSLVLGINSRRALLSYRREVDHDDDDPLFQTIYGTRLKPLGLRSLMDRISKRTGIHITPHALRRTFATLSLRAGMNLLHLQATLGHSSLDMTRRYVQMLDEDLIEAHRQDGPIDTIVNCQ
jgi:integrase/recombinase XerD